MKARSFIYSITVCACLVLAGMMSFPASSHAGEVPSVEGTYELVSRTLPNGTVLKEPDVIGTTTYTKDERHVLFVIKGENGEYGGLIIRSKYSLTEKSYTEENLAFLKNFGAKTIEAPLGKGTSPVTIRDGGIEFALPTANNLPIVIKGDTMTIGEKGKQPVDIYKKVK